MRLKLTAVGFFAAALLIGPAAHAFTVENKDSEGAVRRAEVRP